MSKLLIALFIAAGLGFAGVGSAQTYAPKITLATASTTKDGYARARKDADAQYQLDKTACSSLSGNAKDICVAEGKGRDDVTRAEAAAAYENTPKSRETARVAHAQASDNVSIDKCDASRDPVRYDNRFILVGRVSVCGIRSRGAGSEAA